jgi:hypothetical protein
MSPRQKLIVAQLVKKFPAYYAIQLLQKVLQIVCNLPRHIPTRDLHLAFKIPYLYNFIAKLCRQQAAVTESHDNVNIPNIGQGEAQHTECKGPNFVAASHTIVLESKLSCL